MKQSALSWFGIARLGLVQAALGSIVVLTTSTFNRVMVVELALAATVPGALVGLHYALQVLRPRFGYGSDIGGRRTPWIIGGMAVLASGAILAALALALVAENLIFGLALATLGFALIGMGVGAAGTTLLVLLTARVDPSRRAAAATTTWVMMIIGFIVTAAIAGHFLDPYTPARLVGVTMAVGGLALLITVVTLWGIEAPVESTVRVDNAAAVGTVSASFMQALAEVWSEPSSRRFALFVFIAMLAFSAQDLILEPFAGSVFGFTPGQSTQLAGVQNAGVLLGMLLVGLCADRVRARIGLRGWILGGCIASAFALFGLALAGLVHANWPLRANVFALGVANGVFAVAAIASMMERVRTGVAGREGLRMGLWGASQALAFGLGGFLGTLGSDLARYLLGSPTPAYAAVFTVEALLFLVAILLIPQLAGQQRTATHRESLSLGGARRAA